MLNWRIYYEDNSFFDNTLGTIEEAPAFGVLVIVQASKTVGRYLIHGFPYYWNKKNEWYGGDLAGLFDYLLSTSRFNCGLIYHLWDDKKVDLFGLFDQISKSGLIKFGRSTDNDHFHKVLMEAANNPDFPIKSGLLQHRESKT